VKQIGRRQALERSERFSGDTFAFQNRTRLSLAASITTRTIAAEHELSPVARQEGRGEFRISRDRISAGVSGEIAIDVGIIGKYRARWTAT
jgi:hypothetical protein